MTIKLLKNKVIHSFDRNGSLVVNAYSLLTSQGFKEQLEAAEKIPLATSNKERPKAEGDARPSPA